MLEWVIALNFWQGLEIAVILQMANFQNDLTLLSHFCKAINLKVRHHKMKCKAGIFPKYSVESRPFLCKSTPDQPPTRMYNTWNHDRPLRGITTVQPLNPVRFWW